QRVGPEHADAVVLAAATVLDYPKWRLDVGERQIGPGKAAQRRLDAEPGAGALSVGVLSRQVPVDQVVVGELGVVGDVGQVLEDLLARARDGGRHGEGVHARDSMYGPVRPPSRDMARSPAFADARPRSRPPSRAQAREAYAAAR